ncbi:hypothetical protein M409DRAFT_22687 [Zasmidium cellare ATCC 36951]|uniref:Uncharacterized protein n=1 Tax=Zasmidium cellare ATCC 36951 TaxID=1080233 RepID=A0A6A6CM75_ZASCE|nr:uncharacterized protein M409DRAFT_22687 [Zasmidium cellare ATCC 36951]KAF2167260.1 hypothetical protein M409DRAFT_22687 [Zasmidium cellare ATCC 36951]
MSAPNEGRQSPEPERQSDSQLHQPSSSNPNQQGGQPGDKAADASKDQLSNLSSNPGGPLDKEAEKKTAK